MYSRTAARATSCIERPSRWARRRRASVSSSVRRSVIATRRMVSVVIPPWAQSRCETPCVGSAAAAGGRKARVEEDAVSLAYRFLYRIGFTPWEEMEKLADQIVPLFEREENGAEAPYGPVLDIGCGSGIWATKLARRGWQVTGVDDVPRALTRAR